MRLAFDTMEKIVREHFTVITETDVGVFADCVNCLTCFTNQSHDDNVALNAIAFLRFCAIRLAEGSIGDVDNLPEEVTSPFFVPSLLLAGGPPHVQYGCIAAVSCTLASCWAFWCGPLKAFLSSSVHRHVFAGFAHHCAPL